MKSLINFFKHSPLYTIFLDNIHSKKLKKKLINDFIYK